MSLTLAGCSGGADTMARGTVPAAPATDLDTAKSPPQTVTSAPLLPPVPEPAANQQSAQAEQPPLPYDGLATDEEQAKMQADLMAAAAKARQNN